MLQPRGVWFGGSRRNPQAVDDVTLNAGRLEVGTCASE